MTTDINVIVAEKMAAMTEGGEIRNLIENATQEAVEKSIKDAIASYKFRNRIEEAVGATIKVNIDDLGLPGYNVLVTDIVRAKLANAFETSVKTEIEKQISELLSGFPSEIKVSELAEMFREFCAGDEESGTCTILVKRSDHSDGWFDLYFDKEQQDSWHRCEYQVRVKDDGVWAVKIGDFDSKKQLFIGPCWRFEKFLFHAYTNKIKVVLDEEEPDTSYGRGED